MMSCMLCWLTLLLRLAAAMVKSRGNLLLENLALRHQLLLASWEIYGYISSRFKLT